MTNIKISETAVYHPNNQVGNDFYFEHFDKKGKDIRRLLKHIGRENRYLVDSNNGKETGITMGVEVSKKVLDTKTNRYFCRRVLSILYGRKY